MYPLPLTNPLLPQPYYYVMSEQPLTMAGVCGHKPTLFQSQPCESF